MQVQGDKTVQTISQSMGVSSDGYVDFMMGVVYTSSQTIFRKESQLDEKISDELLLAFWLKEGRDIRNRLIQLIEK